MFEIGTATDYADLLDRLHTFLTAIGSAFGLEYTGTGDGTFTAYSGGADSVAETFTITATSATNFTVVGSVTGSLPAATVGTPYSEDEIAFLLTAGATPFVSSDEFTISTAPKWTSKRKALGCRVTATQVNTGAYGSQNLVDGKDDVSSRYWYVGSPVTLPQDIEFEFFEAETIDNYVLTQMNSAAQHAYGPKAWTFDYWTGSAWSTLDSQSDITDWNETGLQVFDIGSPVSATKYRLHITEIVSSSLYLGAVRLRRSDNVDAAFSQTIWEAPGNDGDSAILCGAHLFERQDADYFNMEVASFDGFLATSLWRNQAGFHGNLYVPMWDASIPYWFVADGRRAIVVAKLNTQYEVAYFGLLDCYFSPEQWPYPVALGGSLALGDTVPAWNDDDWRWSNADNEHRAFPLSGPPNGSVADVGYRQMRVRGLDGTWLGFDGTVGGTHYSSFANRNVIWPYISGLELLDANLDGSYTRFPLMLNAETPNTIGQPIGVACVTGQGLTSETLMRDGQIDWMALHNIFRTDRDEFYAVALD